jgi:hypothetical protein
MVSFYTHPLGGNSWQRGLKMDEKLCFYYSSQIETPWCDLKNISAFLKKLSEAGISVSFVDTAEMDSQQLGAHYTIATYPSVHKQYRIRQIFGSQNKSGHYFGRQQPALLVYHDESTHPIDTYPHDENGTRIGILDFLQQKLSALNPETAEYEILDTFTCHVEAVSEKYAYLRLRNLDDDDDQDLCMEYPFSTLEAEIGDVDEGMSLRCEIREFDDDRLAFHFEKSTPQPLTLAERQALLEHYKGLLEDAE